MLNARKAAVVLAAVVALPVLTAGPALASSNSPAHDRKEDRSATQTHERSNPNAHADKSGSSSNSDGTFQGKSQSKPDQDGTGANKGANNNDKTGRGTDGNNGCGNEPRGASGRPTDDDNNGNCGGTKASTSKSSSDKPAKSGESHGKAKPAKPAKPAHHASPAKPAKPAKASNGHGSSGNGKGKANNGNNGNNGKAKPAKPAKPSKAAKPAVNGNGKGNASCNNGKGGNGKGVNGKGNSGKARNCASAPGKPGKGKDKGNASCNNGKGGNGKAPYNGKGNSGKAKNCTPSSTPTAKPTTGSGQVPVAIEKPAPPIVKGVVVERPRPVVLDNSTDRDVAATAARGSLPFTGTEVAQLLAIAMITIGTGLGFMVMGRLRDDMI